MDVEEDVLGNNCIEDASWLCQLSESELDFLMSLKMLVLQRTKVIRHEELAEKFDLKMLRALAAILMEYLKGKAKNSCEPWFAESFDTSNLLRLNKVMSIEEIKLLLSSDSKKRSGES